MLEGVLGIAIAGFVLLIIIGLLIKANLVLCAPNEVVVLSGRKHRTPDGEEVGYRWFKGGRAVKWPLLEKADRMDLNSMNLQIAVPGAITKGGIRINIQAIANVKIHGEMPFLGNALERLLGKADDNIRQIAREQLEANLRGAASALTPEEINEDRVKFAQELSAEADADLNKLGFDLDTLKIQDVSDESGYLEAIGRRKTAEVLKDAEIAESQARKEAETVKSQNEALMEIQRTQAQTDARSKKASLDQQADIAEAQAKAATEIETAQREADARETAAEAQRRSDVAEAQAKSATEIEKAQREADAKETAAEAQRRSDVAGAQAKSATEIEKAQREADAKETAAEAQRRSDVAMANAQQEIAEAQGALRVKQAQADGASKAAENEAEEKANLARVQAQKLVETERLELQKQQLQVQVIEPAEAAKKAAELEAAGQVATAREQGELEVELLRKQRQTIEEGGKAGEKLLIINMLPELVKPMVEAAAAGKPDSVVILGSPNGQGENGQAGGVENTMLQVYRDLLMFGPMYQAAIKNMTGIDVAGALGAESSTSEPSAADDSAVPAIEEGNPAANSESA